MVLEKHCISLQVWASLSSDLCSELGQWVQWIVKRLTWNTLVNAILSFVWSLNPETWNVLVEIWSQSLVKRPQSIWCKKLLPSDVVNWDFSCDLLSQNLLSWYCEFAWRHVHFLDLDGNPTDEDSKDTNGGDTSHWRGKGWWPFISKTNWLAKVVKLFQDVAAAIPYHIWYDGSSTILL